MRASTAGRASLALSILATLALAVAGASGPAAAGTAALAAPAAALSAPAATLPALRPLDDRHAAELRQAFDEAKDRARYVVALSPT